MISLNTFKALEASLSTRVQGRLVEITKDIYAKVEKELEAGEYGRAESLINRLTLYNIFDGLDDYLSYITRLTMLFGASGVSPNPKYTTVGLGYEDEAQRMLVFNFKNTVVLKITDVLKNYGLQSIAIRREKNTLTQKAETPRILLPFSSFMNAEGEAYLNIVSSLHTSRVSAYGFTAEARALGITEYQLSEQLDDRICPLCQIMHGKVFKVVDARSLLDKVTRETDPEEIKKLQPWPKQTKENLELIKGMSTEELVANSWHTPPFHPRPVSEDTEFLSDSGWKLVKNAKVGDVAFSLNADTKKVEWVSVVGFVEGGKPANGMMVQFKSQNFDLLVTEDHEQVYKQYLNKGYTYALKPARELLKYSKVTIPRTGLWSGGKCHLSNEMVQFLALWISDGSCIKKGESSYYITVCTRKYGVLAKELLQAITGGAVYIRKNTVECNSYKLGEYLYNVIGTGCLGKKIPTAIMEADRETITLFLNTYLIGDGSICSTNGDYGSSVNKTFYTTSPVLAAQLGELIVKVGGFPSYTTQDNSLNPQFIGSRMINSNHLIHRVRWCIGKTATFGKTGKGVMGLVPYSGNTYCLSLESNYIFYARRNGKCTWTGNCRGLLRRVGKVPPLAEVLDKTTPKPEYVASSADFEGLGVKADATLVDSWNKHVKMPPSEFLAVTRGIALPDFLNGLVESKNAAQYAGNPKFKVLEDGVQISSKSYVVGSKETVEQVIKIRGSSMILDKLALAEKDQATGVAKSYLQRIYQLASDLNLKKLELTAGNELGGYAWAKYGFRPNAEQWAILRKSVKQALNTEVVVSEVDGLVQDVVSAILDSTDPAMIYLLADIGYTLSTGVTIGEQALQGQHWDGELDMNDPEAIEKFLTYIGVL